MEEAWQWRKFFYGPFKPRNYGKIIIYAICAVVMLLLLSGIVKVKEALFPSKQQAGTTSTIGKVESGGVVKNITIQSPKLKQGIYGELSSNDFGVGIFKEVMPNIDISLGVEKDFDEDEIEAKVQTRFKF